MQPSLRVLGYGLHESLEVHPTHEAIQLTLTKQSLLEELAMALSEHRTFRKVLDEVADQPHDFSSAVSNVIAESDASREGRGDVVPSETRPANLLDSDSSPSRELK